MTKLQGWSMTVQAVAFIVVAATGYWLGHSGAYQQAIDDILEGDVRCTRDADGHIDYEYPPGTVGERMQPIVVEPMIDGDMELPLPDDIGDAERMMLTITNPDCDVPAPVCTTARPCPRAELETWLAKCGSVGTYVVPLDSTLGKECAAQEGGVGTFTKEGP